MSLDTLAREGSPLMQGAAGAARVLLGRDDADAFGVRVGSFIDVGGPTIRASNPVTAPDRPPELLRKLISQRLYDVNLPIEVGGRDYGVLRLSFDVDLVGADIWHLTQYTLLLALVLAQGGDPAGQGMIQRYAHDQLVELERSKARIVDAQPAPSGLPLEETADPQVRRLEGDRPLVLDGRPLEFNQAHRIPLSCHGHGRATKCGEHRHA